MVFLIIQDLSSKFKRQRVDIVFTLKIRERQTPITQLGWWDWRSSINLHRTMNHILTTFHSRSAKVPSRKYPQGLLKNRSWNDEIEGAVSIFMGLWITLWWLFKAGPQKFYPQGLLKNQSLLLLTTLTDIFEFQKAMHSCVFCFCLGISRPFASDTSPKWIER